MMKASLVIWIVGDGKPGHENQSIGVAEAIQRKVDCQVCRISLRGDSVIGKVRHAWREAASLPRPDFVIGAGHATHVPLLVLSRKFGGRSVVMMKPSLPIRLFDSCIAPKHDFPEGYSHPKLLTVHGAPHRVRPAESIESKDRGLVLIGGPVLADEWDGGRMREILEGIVTEGNWVVSDSRRTPADWFGSLVDDWKSRDHIEFVSHLQTGADWVPQMLQRCDPIWVTEDSVSMICEAAGSGGRVGILPMPGARKDGRVRKGIESMVREGYATWHQSWLKQRKLTAESKPLLEADRCADWLLQQIGI
jgi:uncharacterized protein